MGMTYEEERALLGRFQTPRGCWNGPHGPSWSHLAGRAQNLLSTIPRTGGIPVPEPDWVPPARASLARAIAEMFDAPHSDPSAVDRAALARLAGWTEFAAQVEQRAATLLPELLRAGLALVGETPASLDWVPAIPGRGSADYVRGEICAAATKAVANAAWLTVLQSLIAAARAAAAPPAAPAASVFSRPETAGLSRVARKAAFVAARKAAGVR